MARRTAEQKESMMKAIKEALQKKLEQENKDLQENLKKEKEKNQVNADDFDNY